MGRIRNTAKNEMSKKGKKKATFLFLERIHECTRAFGSLGELWQRSRAGAAPHTSWQWLPPGLSAWHLQQTPKSHMLRNKYHWTTTLLHCIRVLLSGSQSPIMAARTALGSQPFQVWQACILHLLLLLEGFWELLRSNANRSLIDICMLAFCCIHWRLEKGGWGKMQKVQRPFFLCKPHFSITFNEFWINLLSTGILCELMQSTRMKCKMCSKR